MSGGKMAKRRGKMAKRMVLLADIARCHGTPDAPICQTCARRVQMAHDGSTRWYSYMTQKPDPDGTCRHWIEEVKL